MKHRATISSELRLFIILIIAIILVTDIVSLISRINKNVKVASEEITQTLSEANYQESTIRMSKLLPGQMDASASLEAMGLPNLPIGNDKTAKPVLFLYKRVITDTTNTAGPLEDLVNGAAEGSGLTDKLNSTLNAIKVDARDINFAVYDSLLTASLKEKKLSSAYQLELKRQKDTLEIIGQTKSKNFHQNHFDKTFTYPLNAEGTVWYEYQAFMPGVIMSQDEDFIVSDIFFSILTILMLVVLYFLFRKSDEVDKRSEEFLHMLTHDMKSPVSVIKLTCGELAETCSDITPERAAYLSIIERNCDLLQSKIETIIPLTDRLKAGVKSLTKVNLSAFVSHLANSISLKSKETSIVVDLHPDLCVNADPDLLDVIFRNLIENAIKYGPKDATTVINVTDTMKNNGTCVVTVSDNGIGISKRNIPLIFTKFYKVNTDQSDSKKSFGLGLYSVKESVDMMGWKIDVESTLGKGSSFIITIPETL